jgi:hypothetical protein
VFFTEHAGESVNDRYYAVRKTASNTSLTTHTPYLAGAGGGSVELYCNWGSTLCACSGCAIGDATGKCWIRGYWPVVLSAGRKAPWSSSGDRNGDGYRDGDGGGYGNVDGMNMGTATGTAMGTAMKTTIGTEPRPMPGSTCSTKNHGWACIL